MELKFMDTLVFFLSLVPPVFLLSVAFACAWCWPVYM